MAFRIHDRDVIVLGDKTTHGGEVITASATFRYLGKAVARVGDQVSCPKCGTNKIVEGAETVFDQGNKVALHDCLTACGARLIANSNGQDNANILNGTLYADAGNIVTDAGGTLPPQHLSAAQKEAIQTAAEDWANSNVPYAYGGSTKQGADCSGSISSIYKQAGIDIGRLQSQQFSQPPFYPVPPGSPLEIGDVAVYNNPQHVAMYRGVTDSDRDVWSAFTTGGKNFGTAKSSWFHGTPIWYRYNGQ